MISSPIVNKKSVCGSPLVRGHGDREFSRSPRKRGVDSACDEDGSRKGNVENCPGSDGNCYVQLEGYKVYVGRLMHLVDTQVNNARECPDTDA